MGIQLNADYNVGMKVLEVHCGREPVARIFMNRTQFGRSVTSAMVSGKVEVQYLNATDSNTEPGENEVSLEYSEALQMVAKLENAAKELMFDSSGLASEIMMVKTALSNAVTRTKRWERERDEKLADIAKREQRVASAGTRDRKHETNNRSSNRNSAAVGGFGSLGGKTTFA